MSDDYYHPEVEVRRAKQGDGVWPLRWVGMMDTGSLFGPSAEFMAMTQAGVLKQVKRYRRKRERASQSSEIV